MRALQRLFAGNHELRLQRLRNLPSGLARLAVGLALPALALCLVAVAGLVLHQLLGLVVSHAGWLQAFAVGGVLMLLLASPLLVLGLAAGANRRDRAWARARVRNVDERVFEALHTIEHDIEGL